MRIEQRATTEDSFGALAGPPNGVEQVVENPERIGLAKRLNLLMEELTLSERVRFVIEHFPGEVLATTSGGIQSRLIPTLLSEEHKGLGLSDQERVPIVFLDTGDLFPESIAYVDQFRRELNLDVQRYKHDLTPQEFRNRYRELVSEEGRDGDDAFDELTKVLPMQAVLELLDAKVWIAGNRRDQASSRADLPFVELQNGVLKIFPLADVTSTEVSELLVQKGIPYHPLSKEYRSVGNKGDTLAASSGEGFEKDGRHNGKKTECGLHLDWDKTGATASSSEFGVVRIPW